MGNGSGNEVAAVEVPPAREAEFQALNAKSQWNHLQCQFFQSG